MITESGASPSTPPPFSLVPWQRNGDLRRPSCAGTNHLSLTSLPRFPNELTAHSLSASLDTLRIKVKRYMTRRIFAGRRCSCSEAHGQYGDVNARFHLHGFARSGRQGARFCSGLRSPCDN